MNKNQDDMENEAGLVADLVTANHILYSRGVVDGFGHVSVRSARTPERFFMARSIAPALVKNSDIVTLDMEGNVCGDSRPSYLERFIHSEIYRARPDVQSVIHSHSPAVLPFTVARDVKLRPICHMCGFIGAGAPVFEIRSVAGDASDMLIRDRTLGAALAHELGEHAVILMRGHGSTTVGGTLKQAVFRAVYTELNAKLQMAALQLGAVTYLTAQEADAVSRTNDQQIDRTWELWVREAGAGSTA